MNKSLLLLAAVVVVALSVTAGSASAYGGKASYQVGFAFNCDNPAVPLCAPAPAGFGLGGEWGWYAFNSDHTFDAQIAFCGHGASGSGASHASESGIWMTGAPALPALFGQQSDFLISFDGGLTWQDTSIPATVGHYSAKLAPGVSAEAQVSGG